MPTNHYTFHHDHQKIFKDGKPLSLIDAVAELNAADVRIATLEREVRAGRALEDADPNVKANGGDSDLWEANRTLRAARAETGELP